MRAIMLGTLALVAIGTALSGTLLAVDKIKVETAAAMDVQQLTSAAKNLPVVQVNEPF